MKDDDSRMEETISLRMKRIDFIKQHNNLFENLIYNKINRVLLKSLIPKCDFLINHLV